MCLDAGRRLGVPSGLRGAAETLPTSLLSAALMIRSAAETSRVNEARGVARQSGRPKPSSVLSSCRRADRISDNHHAPCLSFDSCACVHMSCSPATPTSSSFCCQWRSRRHADDKKTTAARLFLSQPPAPEGPLTLLHYHLLPIPHTDARSRGTGYSPSVPYQRSHRGTEITLYLAVLPHQPIQFIPLARPIGYSVV